MVTTFGSGERTRDRDRKPGDGSCAGEHGKAAIDGEAARPLSAAIASNVVPHHAARGLAVFARDGKSNVRDRQERRPPGAARKIKRKFLQNLL